MIDNGKWSRENEKKIKEIEKVIVQGFLLSGFNVVVDDTNFGNEDFWKNIAVLAGGAEFEVKFFDTPLMTCIERDLKRGEKSWGAKVIMGMYNQFLKPLQVAIDTELPDVYLFDIDGTLAKMDGRSPYDYTKVSTDKVNRDVARMFKEIKDKHPIIIVSGREDSCQEATKQWLLDNELYYSDLIMREAGDKRDDRIVKREIYEKYIKGKYNVLGVFDDRDRVVEMWRSLGLTCFQVDYGNF